MARMINSKRTKTVSFKNILLIGDSILDVYIYCDIVSRALYAPIPEVEERRSVISFGGNGLVASHILELGGKLCFVSIVGADVEAKHYNSFKHPNLKKFFLVDQTRRTTVKRRWYVKNKALLQANQVDNHNINSALEKQVVRVIKKNIKKTDLVVIMDPQHGMMTKSLIRKIIQLSEKNKKPTYVDAQISHRRSNHYLYRGVDTMFLNQKEAKAVYSKFSDRKIKEALCAIKEKFGLKNVVIKLGKRGSVALWNNKVIKTPGHQVKTIDVCGAGDAFLAAFSLGDRDKPEEALRVANIWAGLSVAIHGTVPPKKKDLLTALR